MMFIKLNVDNIRMRTENQDRRSKTNQILRMCWLHGNWGFGEKIRRRIDMARQKFFKMKALFCNHELTTRGRATKFNVVSLLLHGGEE